MKMKHTLIISMLALGAMNNLTADEATPAAHPNPAMMQGQGGMMPNGNPAMAQQQGGMPMMQGGMMNNPKMMEMKQAHMAKMEQHMAKMEALMQELVDLQKAQAVK